MGSPVCDARALQRLFPTFCSPSRSDSTRVRLYTPRTPEIVPHPDAPRPSMHSPSRDPWAAMRHCPVPFEMRLYFFPGPCPRSASGLVGNIVADSVFSM